MTKQQHFVSIIVPCFNEEKHIEDTIKTLFDLDYDNNLLEVIIVDGFSTDHTRGILNKSQKKYKSLRIIDNPYQITPYAFNLGIEASKGDIIFIVGARQHVSSNYISHCLDILDSDPEIAGVGGIMYNLYDNNNAEAIALAMKSPVGVGGGNWRAKHESGFVDTIGTPIYKKSIFKKIGLFDTHLVRNQDDELNYRILKQGFKLFLSKEINIKYYVRDSFKNLFKQYYQYGYWKVFVNKKHKTITTFRQIVPPLFVLFIFFGSISLFFPPLQFLYIALIAIYITSVLVVSILNAKKIIIGILTAFATSILHISYGIGYLQGVLDVFLLKKAPSKKNKLITR